MKSLLISAFLLICTNHILWAQNSVKLLQSTVNYRLMSTSAQGFSIDSTSYEYYADHKILNTNYFYNSDTGLYLHHRTVNQYDPNGKLSSETSQAFLNGGWTNWSRYTYEYNVALNQLLEEYWDWNGSAWGQPTPSVKYSFDLHGNTILYDDLLLKERYSCTYNAEGRPLETVYHRLLDGVWTPVNRSTYEYAADGITLLNNTSYVWNGKGWAYYMRQFNMYDSDGYLNYSYEEIFEASEWRLRSEYDVILNNQHKPLSSTLQAHVDSLIALISVCNYEYDADGDITRLKVESWDVDQPTWQQAEIRYHYFGTQSETVEAPTLNFDISPNPGVDYFTLKGEDIDKLEIYSQDGKLLRDILLQKNDTENLYLDLPTGAYLLRAQNSEGYTGTKTLIIYH